METQVVKWTRYTDSQSCLIDQEPYSNYGCKGNVYHQVMSGKEIPQERHGLQYRNIHNRELQRHQIGCVLLHSGQKIHHVHGSACGKSIKGKARKQRSCVQIQYEICKD